MDVRAVELAERGRYAALLQALALQPELARETDDFGMTPLHWVCSDANAPLHALQRVALAHPGAATARNLAGLLPLHLAVRKRLPIEALAVLLRYDGASILSATPDGKRPPALAMDAGAPIETIEFLEKQEQTVAAMVGKSRQSEGSMRPPSETIRLGEGVYDSTDDADNQAMETIGNNNSATTPGQTDPIAALMASGKITVSAPVLPPEWKLEDRCRICSARFGYLRGRRHHCRNCGESVCGRHSRHAVPLKHLGLFTPQRVCVVCFDNIQQHYTARALARVAPIESLGGFSVPIVPMTSASGVQSMRRAHRSHSAFDDMTSAMATAPCCASLASSPSHSDGGRSGRWPLTAEVNDVESIHLAHVKRNDRLYFPMKSTNELVTIPRSQQRYRKENQQLVARTEERDRKLANTDLETRSAAWNEFLQDTTTMSVSMGDTGGLSSRVLSPKPSPVVPLEPKRQPKLSIDSQVVELEARMERLLEARQRISAALKKSQRDIARARRDKQKLDEVARQFRDMGYTSNQCEDEFVAHAGDNINLLGELEGDEYGECDNELYLVNGSGSSAGTVNTATTETSDTEYEEPPQDNTRYCDDYNNTSTDEDDDEIEYVIKHPTLVVATSMVTRRPRRRPPPTPRLAPSLNDNFHHIQNQDPPTLDVASTHSDLGTALLACGKYSEAIAAFRVALSLDTEAGDVWHHLATALDKAGEYTEAEDATRHALALQPSSSASLSLLGKLLNARGEHDEAIDVFRQVLALQSARTASGM